MIFPKITITGPVWSGRYELKIGAGTAGLAGATCQGVEEIVIKLEKKRIRCINPLTAFHRRAAGRTMMSTRGPKHPGSVVHEVPVRLLVVEVGIRPVSGVKPGRVGQFFLIAPEYEDLLVGVHLE